MAIIQRRALRDGLLGGNRKWLFWGGVAWLLHNLHNSLGEGRPRPVLTQQLDPGERFIILHSPAPPKKARRIRRRA
jgi:hypothetical protein